MALKWYENMGTQLNSKAWNESVEQAKVTNVLGLAWNYYWAYTKFITGADITLDMGLKAEFFYARSYKIGYQSDTSFGVDKTSANQTVKDFHTSVSSAYGSVQSIISTQVAQIMSRNNNVEEDILVVDEASHDYNVLDQVIADALTISVGGAVTESSSSREINTGILTITSDSETTIGGGGIVSIGD